MPPNQIWSSTIVGRPEWAADFGGREHIDLVPIKLDPAQFRAPDAVRVDVGPAGAAQGAVSVPVSPVLTGPIPSGTVLDFGTNKFARLTAAAAAGAATLTVSALPTALVDADVAFYGGTREKSVPSGTAIGRTLSERNANAAWGPAIDTDDEILLVYADVPNLDRSNDAEGYRHTSTVYENFLPNWGDTIFWPAALVTKLRTLYRMIIGEP